MHRHEERKNDTETSRSGIQRDHSVSKIPIVKEKPNFRPSGVLAKESNNINGIALKYTAPQDSTNPPTTQTYQIFSFKEGAKIPKTYNLTRSFYLIGRDEKVVDIKTDDETCSKQHAVIQFRRREDGVKYVCTTISCGHILTLGRAYVIDLESSNGTFLNGEEIPTSRYIELKNEDVLKFGDSTTDNVIMIS
jgi:smad nuclear-interacting protein 1